MADIHGLFWNSVDEDRTYDADSFSEWLNKFFTSGVFKDELQVTAYDGMTIQVSSGYANCKGKVRFFDGTTKLTIATADASNPRIDTVVIECNYVDRDISMKVVTGAYSGNNPKATDPVRNTNAFQLVLAEIYVSAGAVEITQANITDKRPDTSVCGYVTGTVTEMDFSQFTTQWNSYISQFKSGREDEFDAWFEKIKETLDAETLADHENRIAALEKLTPITTAQIDSMLK